VQQVFHVAQRKREADVEHHGETNDLRARLEVAERRPLLGQAGGVGQPPARLKQRSSDSAHGEARLDRGALAKLLVHGAPEEANVAAPFVLGAVERQVDTRCSNVASVASAGKSAMPMLTPTCTCVPPTPMGARTASRRRNATFAGKSSSS
jgi:hypothetical protein